MPVEVTAVTAVVERAELEQRIRAALEGHGVESIAVVSSIAECLEGEARASDAVVVATGDDQSRAGVDLRAISEHLLGAAVVVVMASLSRRHQRSVMRLGADAIVMEDDIERALVPTVAAVSNGQVVVPRSLRFHFETPALSYREKQILGLVVMGYTNGEIAGKLYLAESTVKSHLSSSFEKLGVRSRGEAAELIVDGANGFGNGILAITETRGRAAVSSS